MNKEEKLTLAYFISIMAAILIGVFLKVEFLYRNDSLAYYFLGGAVGISYAYFLSGRIDD